MCRRNARHEVRRTWTRGGKRHADLARGTGIAIRRVRRPLFMAREDVRKFHLIYFIIERKDSTARVAEHDLNALCLQALQKSACTIHLQ